jgi:putative SOS response-associated peptidase YedK
VRYNGKTAERSLDVLRWGLVPFWARDVKTGFANVNARAEEGERKPAFREAFQRRRCLVPVDGFYEWAKTPASSAGIILLSVSGVIGGCECEP